ncbi:hypothetical protein D3C85_1438090 [compost metagenome]
MFRIESTRAQYPDSMVVAQYQIFDRFDGVLTQLVQPDLSRGWSSPRIKADNEVFTFESTYIWIPFSGVREYTFCENF